MSISRFSLSECHSASSITLTNIAVIRSRPRNIHTLNQQQTADRQRCQTELPDTHKIRVSWQFLLRPEVKPAQIMARPAKQPLKPYQHHHHRHPRYRLTRSRSPLTVQLHTTVVIRSCRLVALRLSYSTGFVFCCCDNIPLCSFSFSFSVSTQWLHRRLT